MVYFYLNLVHVIFILYMLKKTLKTKCLHIEEKYACYELQLNLLNTYNELCEILSRQIYVLKIF